MQVRKKQEPPVKPERNSHVKSLTFSFLKGFLKKSKLFQNLLLQIENILEFLKTILCIHCTILELNYRVLKSRIAKPKLLTLLCSVQLPAEPKMRFFYANISAKSKPFSKYDQHVN